LVTGNKKAAFMLKAAFFLALSYAAGTAQPNGNA